MQILKYYINHKGGINNRLVCRIVNHRLQTIITFTGTTAEQRAEKYLRESKAELYAAYNQRNTNINPYAADAKKMPLRRFTSLHINLSIFNFSSFSVSGNIEGMRQKYYGEGALLVRDGDYIYNVTEAPDIYYQHAVK